MDAAPATKLKVPPPTRRSTRKSLGKFQRWMGSSAHAEIDPRQEVSRWAAFRFLRPRGDRPGHCQRRRGDRRVPPPTRRSTLIEAALADNTRGSSAHAEIDPCREAPTSLGPWFLRPRGDRPKNARGLLSRSTVPPPTRRSTRLSAMSRAPSPGSSAHAEIDPHSREGRALENGFLRPRGDRPASMISTTTVMGVPPPTRRSTLSRFLVGRARLGSSAHAEIDPPLF